MGCSTTVFTAPRDSKSRCEPLALRSQIFTVPSSEPLYIHRPSRSKPTAVMLFVCPSNDVMGCGLFVFTSKRRIDGFPAAVGGGRGGGSGGRRPEAWCHESGGRGGVVTLSSPAR